MTHDYNPDNQSSDKLPSTQPSSYNCLRLFLCLLLTPNGGWRKIRNKRVVPSDFERQLFYPLLALTAACQFIVLIYEPSTPIAAVLQNAIVGFVSMFGAYFGILAIAKSFLPPETSKKVESPFFKVYVSASLSVFTTGVLLSLLAPILKVLLWLGMIYTLYITSRGVKYLHVPHNERTSATILMCILTLGLPIAIYMLFICIMPSV